MASHTDRMAPEVLPSYGGLIPLSDTSAINVDARPLLLAVPVWWLEALLYKIRAAVNCDGIGEDGMEFDRVIDCLGVLRERERSVV